jgi:hypothetical protein
VPLIASHIRTHEVKVVRWSFAPEKGIKKCAHVGFALNWSNSSRLPAG